MTRTPLNQACELFDQFLAKKGMRLTRQRRLILERLHNLGRHVSADELCDDLRKDKANRGISKATVYRTLGLLEECGLIEGYDFRQGYLVYEFADPDTRHDHILCVDGETVVEFQNEQLNTLLREITRSYGFEPISHTLTVYARCDACQGDEDHHKNHSHNRLAISSDPAVVGVHEQGHGHSHKLTSLAGAAADNIETPKRVSNRRQRLAAR